MSSKPAQQLFKNFREELILSSADCFFSSTDNLVNIIIKEILSSKKFILLAMYTLTNMDLIKSLIAVKKKGIKIYAIFDEEQLLKFNKIILELNNHDIIFKTVGNSFARMHHKFLVIDNEVTITGSFNWTLQANSKNEENLVIINGKSFSKKYSDEFDRIWTNITSKSISEQIKITEPKIKDQCLNCKSFEVSPMRDTSSYQYICKICGFMEKKLVL